MGRTQDIGNVKAYKSDLRKYQFVKKVIVPFVKSKFNFKVENRYKMPDVPFIAISNHVTNLDMVWIALSIDKPTLILNNDEICP